MGTVYGCTVSEQGINLHVMTLSWNGQVISDPAGINCTNNQGQVRGTCSAAFTAGTTVTLEATPLDRCNTAFSGWHFMDTMATTGLDLVTHMPVPGPNCGGDKLCAWEIPANASGIYYVEAMFTPTNLMLRHCPQAQDPTSCTNTMTDQNNCGACGKQCKDNEICMASVCMAKTWGKLAVNACVKLTVKANN
jgi:hypothetical protein